MYIKSVNRNIKDVFIGEGWDQWARVDLAKNQVVQASIPVSKGLERTIITKVHNFIKRH